MRPHAMEYADISGLAKVRPSPRPLPSNTYPLPSSSTWSRTPLRRLHVTTCARNVANHGSPQVPGIDHATFCAKVLVRDSGSCPTPTIPQFSSLHRQFWVSLSTACFMSV
jgi:hypothetical protein